NAVIVPNGSKGGFYPKQLPAGGDRAQIFEEGREAYCLFIRSLLDITDNLVHGETVTPPNVVAWDDADPYLVVAADKGTATFSDTANGIAIEYGFWLGDAFASGGSAGYDHKAMGITARGGWEAVKRHFREMGKNIQEEPFTVAGVGDMSGDVFGNGMLLSEQIRLVAAFDHRDIFIDPDPDPAASFVERKRLFETPRSTWQDYDKSLISKGGDVFSRSLKSIPLSDEVRAALGVDEPSLTPHELIRAILKAPVELFWLGGIGTYFKSSKEENWRVGDRANDPVRIDADEIGAKVIGEGANLGLTQRARIAFARRGGRVNTDAIDNSAGVDSSDHEVNIKILLSSAIENGALAQDDRNALLASMTDSVAEHVLDHNYDQTRALTLMAEGAPEHLDLHARFMTTLEREDRLNRTVEQLPTAEDIATLRARSLGLTRPELSVLLAYAKLWLFDALVESNTPDDPIFDGEVYAYFPEPLHRYENPLKTHQLRREIIATRLSNEIVDACGVAFMQRIAETSGFEFDISALAYVAVREIFGMVDYGASVDALDNKAPADLQTDLYLEATQLLREEACHIMSSPKAIAAFETSGLKAYIETYREPMRALSRALPDVLPKDAAAEFAARAAALESRGAPAALAYEAASLCELAFGLDIVDLANQSQWSHANVASIFFAVGQRFHIDALRDTADREPPSDNFDKIALRQIVEDLAVRQGQLTQAVIDSRDSQPEASSAEAASAILDQWTEQKGEAVTSFLVAARQLDLSGDTSVGKSALFLRKLDALIESLA
ncbi:MAG: NAD-glutamate dehydrogenase domain-containing protein, partial [Pseudomonadota bacterium]